MILKRDAFTRVRTTRRGAINMINREEESLRGNVSWSDFRPRIAIVTTLGFYLLPFEFRISMMENSRCLLFAFDFERAKRDTNKKLRCSLLFASCLLSLVYRIPTVRLGGCLVLYKSHSSSQRIASAVRRTTAQAFGNCW